MDEYEKRLALEAQQRLERALERVEELIRQGQHPEALGTLMAAAVSSKIDLSVMLWYNEQMSQRYSDPAHILATLTGDEKTAVLAAV
jgi:hypothetical protein